MTETRFASSAGHRIAYRVDGADDHPAIALQHGWSSSKGDWPDYVAAFVAAGYRCISIDSLGHGESDKPSNAEDYARKQRAAHVVSVLDQEGIESAHLLGYSMGGWIACCVAEFHPERLRSLIIGGHCPGTGTTEELGNPPEQPFTFDDLVKAYDIRFGDDVVDAMRHSFDALEDVAGHEEAVATAGVPVLLWKGRDEPVICAKGERVARQRGWDFFAVDGSHGEAAMNFATNMPHLLAFLARVG